jgi:hypothetical protein
LTGLLAKNKIDFRMSDLDDFVYKELKVSIHC